MSQITKVTYGVINRMGLAHRWLIIDGAFNRMVAIQAGELTSVPISEVAGRQRLVPLDDPLIAAVRATGASFGEGVGR